MVGKKISVLEVAGMDIIAHELSLVSKKHPNERFEFRDYITSPAYDFLSKNHHNLTLEQKQEYMTLSSVAYYVMVTHTITAAEYQERLAIGEAWLATRK